MPTTRAERRRQQRRRRGGAGTGHAAGGRRQRHGRLAAQPGRLQQRDRLPALARPRAGLAGRRSVLAATRHRRADGAAPSRTPRACWPCRRASTHALPLSLTDALPSPDALRLDGESGPAHRLARQHLARPAAGARRARACESALQTFRDSAATSSRTSSTCRANRTGPPGCGCASCWSAASWAPPTPTRRCASKLKPEARWEIEQSQQLDAAALYQASVYRSNVYRAFLRAFERFDFVVAPTAQVFPFDAKLAWPQRSAAWRATPTTAGWRSSRPSRWPGCRRSMCARASTRRPADGPADRRADARDLAVLRLGHAYDQACGWGLVAAVGARRACRPRSATPRRARRSALRHSPGSARTTPRSPPATSPPCAA